MKKILHNLSSFIGVILFGVALLIIRHKLKHYHLHDIIKETSQTPILSLLLAILLTFLDYLVLTGYDALALRYLKQPLKYTKIALASFVGYAFSHNATVLGGSAARYRIYSSLGISASDIGKLVIFCVLTFWLGFFSIGGLFFLFQPHQIPVSSYLPFSTDRPLGVMFLTVVFGYLSIILYIKKPLRIREWEFQKPPFWIALGQIAISSLDWALAAAVLYVLLPGHIGLTYPKFLGLFLMAQITGLVSTVPGGLGVFETIILLLLSDYTTPTALIGSLLLYRVIYYLLPLTTASVLLGLHELLPAKENLKRFGLAFGRFGFYIVPQVFASTTFIAGAILLFSGALPTIYGRMVMLIKFLPLPAIEVSHFLGSLIGAMLLILARSLQKRISTAYYLVITLLLAGIVLSILKGLDYEEAIILTIMLLALLPCRKAFYRKGSFLRGSFSPAWVMSIFAVIAFSIWLGLLSHRHVDYSSQLWWHFELNADAPRFLRVTTAVVIFMLLFSFSRLFTAKAQASSGSDITLEEIEPIVKSSPKTYSWLALLGDKKFLCNDAKNAFIMYAIQGRSWIAMGDPVGPQDQWQELLWDFTELCDQYNGWPVFYQVEKENLDLYLDLGLTFLKLGEEARVNLETFSLEGSSRKSLRYSYNKAQKQNYAFSIVPRQDVDKVLDEVKNISDSWLEQKNVREKRFSIGYFNPGYMSMTPLALVKQNEKIIAFANVLAGAEKQELSVDLMRFTPSDLEDVMDYLFIELMLWGRQQGFQWFNLGTAPLSGIENRALAPLWSHTGAFIFKYGEHFYNFRGLRRYKDKFDPQWQPKYLACYKGLMLPRILANLAALISGGITGVVKK
ncbi:MAG: bifunctional lysylphosphatidylglycerol flippase/synthetase MprF [Sedimentisphaerales bacterium]